MNELTKVNEITSELLSRFIDCLIDSINEYIPNIIKLVLKLIYIAVIENFTIKETNYSPLYTALFFNFIISPKCQKIYGFSPVNKNIKNFIRFMKNFIFNTLFDEGDNLFYLNDLILAKHDALNEMIEKVF